MVVLWIKFWDTVALNFGEQTRACAVLAWCEQRSREERSLGEKVLLLRLLCYLASKVDTLFVDTRSACKLKKKCPLHVL